MLLSYLTHPASTFTPSPLWACSNIGRSHHDKLLEKFTAFVATSIGLPWEDIDDIYKSNMFGDSISFGLIRVSLENIRDDPANVNARDKRNLV